MLSQLRCALLKPALILLATLVLTFGEAANSYASTGKDCSQQIGQAASHHAAVRLDGATCRTNDSQPCDALGYQPQQKNLLKIAQTGAQNNLMAGIASTIPKADPFSVFSPEGLAKVTSFAGMFGGFGSQLNGLIQGTNQGSQVFPGQQQFACAGSVTPRKPIF